MFSIREATPYDNPDLSHIYWTCSQQADWLPSSAKNQVDFARDTEGEIIWVAVDCNGQVLGFVSIWRPDSFVHHLYIAPSAQGQGIGSALLASLTECIPRPWRLKCVQSNTIALTFYQKQGWKKVGDGHSPTGDYWLLELA